MSEGTRAVLFDFGGVIAEEGFRAGLQALAERDGIDPDVLPRVGMEAVYDSGYVTGAGTEADFWALMRHRTGLQGNDAELSEECLSRFIVRDSMLKLVRRLRDRGYLAAMLSDQTDWLHRLDRRIGFLKEFDRVFVSYELGKGKRDPSLFDDVIDALGIQPQEAVFIDDDPGNVARARKRGLASILFKDEKTLVAELESKLTRSS